MEKDLKYDKRLYNIEKMINMSNENNVNTSDELINENNVSSSDKIIDEIIN